LVKRDGSIPVFVLLEASRGRGWMELSTSSTTASVDSTCHPYPTLPHCISLCISTARDQSTISVGVVPNSLQDIGRASDEAKRRPVAGGLGRSVATISLWQVVSKLWLLLGFMTTSMKFDLPLLNYDTRFSLWQVKMRGILA
jgi:hypothetical protein